MKTIREAPLGKVTLRLVEQNPLSFIGLVIDGGVRLRIEGSSADEVWRRLNDEAGKSGPRYFGFDGARERFLRFFPNGFQSTGYTGQERDYKVAAKTKLDAAAPLETAPTATGLGEAVWSVYQTNLLSPFEKMRVKDLLRGPDSDSFIQAAAEFANGAGQAALAELDAIARPHDCAKWTVITYLPFLWRPDSQMYLKPEATKDFAGRVGHRFSADYQAKLSIGVYESLLDLAAKTESKIADLEPRDRIDLQSFIYVVGEYRDGIEVSQP